MKQITMIDSCSCVGSERSAPLLINDTEKLNKQDITSTEQKEN